MSSRNSRSFVRDFIGVGISHGAVVAFSLARAIVTARWLGPEANGLIAALAVYPTVFMSIGSLGIRQSTTYYVGQGLYGPERIRRAIFQIWFFTSVLSLFACYWLIRDFSNSGSDTALVYLAIAPIPFNIFNTYSSGVFLGQNRISTFNKINWLPSLFMLIGTLGLVVYMNLDIKGAMMANALGPFIMFVVLIIGADFRHGFSLRLEFTVIRSLLSLGIVYALALLIIDLNYKADVMILDKMSTSYEVGIYTKGVTLTEYLWQVPMLLGTLIFARSANAKDGIEFSRKAVQVLRLSLTFILIASIIILWLSRDIIVLLFGASFAGSAEVLRMLLPGVILLTVFKVLNMDLAGKGKPWVSMKAMLPALLINVALNIRLVPEFGAAGSAAASAISYSIAAVLFLYLYMRETTLSFSEIFAFSLRDYAVFGKYVRRGLKA